MAMAMAWRPGRQGHGLAVTAKYVRSASVLTAFA